MGKVYSRALFRESKVVNVWFQNKRRSMKKKSIAWNRATVLMSENAFGMGKARFSTLAHPSKQKSLIRRDPTVSLDSIAAFREKKEALTYPRPPFTPRKNTVANLASSTERMDIGDDKSSLWDLLPSSPQLPPSSPTKETTLLSALPPQSRTMKSLEWACAKDRVGRRKKTQDMLRDLEEDEDDDDEQDVPDLMLDSTGGDDTDIDEDMITPDNSMSLSTIPIPERHRTSSLESRKGKADEDTPNEDVESTLR